MKKIFPLTALIFLFGGVIAISSAQITAGAPKLFLTWSTNTYVPAGFSGKAMPTSNSTINASAELIDGGKIADVSKQNVYWYVNNNFIAGGIGLQSISFQAPDNSAGGAVDLRAEIPNYSKGNQLKTVTIPIVRPGVVIEAPFPSGKFKSSSLKLIGQPYFFNVTGPSRLIFIWSVNGQTPTGAENPQSLNIKLDPSMPAGSGLSISLSIQNADKKYEFETGSKNMNLTYSP